MTLFLDKGTLVLQPILNLRFLAIPLLLLAQPVAASDELPEKWQAERELFNELSDAACAGDEAAAQKVRSAAEVDHSAQAMMAQRWLLTTGDCPQYTGTTDTTRALLDEAAETGYPLALAMLGQHLLRGEGGRTQDVQRGKQLLQDAMDGGYPRAALVLAWDYTSGKNLKKNLLMAKGLAESALMMGADPDAVYTNLGRIAEAQNNWADAISYYELSKSSYAAKRLAAVKERKAKDEKLSASSSSTEVSSPATVKYAALATSEDDGGFGWSYDHADETEARARAKDECKNKGGAACRTKLVLMGSGCGAYRYADGGSPYGWGVARNREAAEARAMEECRARNGNAACTGGSGWICNSKTPKASLQIVYEAANDSRPKAAGTDTSGCPVSFRLVCPNFTGARYDKGKSAGKLKKRIDIFSYLPQKYIDFPGCGSKYKNGISFYKGKYRCNGSKCELPGDTEAKLKRMLHDFADYATARFPGCQSYSQVTIGIYDPKEYKWTGKNMPFCQEPGDGAFNICIEYPGK